MWYTVLLEDTKENVHLEAKKLINDFKFNRGLLREENRDMVIQTSKRVAPLWDAYEVEQTRIRMERERREREEEKKTNQALLESKMRLTLSRVRAQIAVLTKLIAQDRLTSSLSKAELGLLCPRVSHCDLIFEGSDRPFELNEQELEILQHFRTLEPQGTSDKHCVGKFVRSAGENEIVVTVNGEERTFNVEKEDGFPLIEPLRTQWLVTEGTVMTENETLSGLKVVKRMDIGDRVRQLGCTIHCEKAVRLKVQLMECKSEVSGRPVGYLTLKGTKGSLYLKEIEHTSVEADGPPRKIRKIDENDPIPRILLPGERVRITPDTDDQTEPRYAYVETFGPNDTVTIAWEKDESHETMPLSKIRFVTGAPDAVFRPFRFNPTKIESGVRVRLSELKKQLDTATQTFFDAHQEWEKELNDGTKASESIKGAVEAIEKHREYCLIRYNEFKAMGSTALDKLFSDVITMHNELQKRINTIYGLFVETNQKRIAEKERKEFEERMAEMERKKKEQEELKRQIDEKRKTNFEKANELVNSVSSLKVASESVEALNAAEKVIKPLIQELREQAVPDREGGNMLMQLIRMENRVTRGRDELRGSMFQEHKKRLQDFWASDSSAGFLTQESWTESDFEVRNLPVLPGVSYPLDKSTFDVVVKNYFVPREKIPGHGGRKIEREVVEIVDGTESQVQVKVKSTEDDAIAWCSRDILDPVPMIYKIVKETVLTQGVDKLEVLCRLKVGEEIEVRGRPQSFHGILRCLGKIRDQMGWFTIITATSEHAKAVC